MSKEGCGIDFFKTTYSVEYIIIKRKGRNQKKYENISVFLDPNFAFILDKNETITIIPIQDVLEIKYTKESSKLTSMMIEYQIKSSYPQIFENKPTDIEIG